MRLVLDTNVALSGLLWRGGPPSALIDAAVSNQISLVTSIALLSELRGVLEREKFLNQLRVRGIPVDDLFYGYAELADIVIPAELDTTITRDSTDVAVLAAAVGGGAELIVSGDSDLLDLKRYQQIDIVSPARALAIISRTAL